MAIRWIKTSLAIAILTSFLISQLCAQSTVPTADEAIYGRAEGLLRNRQWDDGLALLLPLIAKEPRNLKALNLIGIAYGGKGQSERADQYFERCLRVNVNFLPALKNMAISEFNARQYGPAEKHLKRLQRQVPDDLTVSVYLGQTEYHLHNFKLAAEELNRGRELMLRDPNITAYLAISLLRSGQKQPGLDLLDRIKPEQIDPQSQLMLGVALAENGMDAQAVPYLQGAFLHDRNSYDTGFDLAVACIQSKNYATAIEASQQLIRRGHDTSELENVLAEALGASGDTQGAIEAYKKAIVLDPQDEGNYLDFASLCIDHKAFDDGMKVIAAGLSVHSKSDRLIFMRGILNALQDKFDLAEQDFQQAAQLAPQHDLGAVGLGSVYLEQGHSEQALVVIRDRLGQKPDDASLLYLLGEALIASGTVRGQPAYIEAKQALEKSVLLRPDLCLPHVSLGALYLDEDRFADAVVQLEAARSIDPTEKSAYSHLAVAYRGLGRRDKSNEALAALKQILQQDRAGARVKDQGSVGPN